MSDWLRSWGVIGSGSTISLYAYSSHGPQSVAEALGPWTGVRGYDERMKRR